MGAAETRRPRRWVQVPLRPVARTVARRRWGVRVHGRHHVPRRGPVILACNHIGLLDGPLVVAFAPRPVHALTKIEMFSGRAGPFFRATGQIPLDRFHVDRRAVRTSVRTLEHGGVLGIFPEGTRGAGDLGRFHRGAAYLALVTGAPVVPVTLLGTRAAGGHTNEMPPRGGPVDIVFGEPVRLAAQPWPRTKEQVGQASLLLRGHMLARLQEAQELTGQTLPGPLPPGEMDDDPRTGVVERGAR